jgi:hypothetical protein
MLQEPFWLGLITVFVVLAVIGLVWCAKRHFPEKIEKLLQEEADRNRRNYESMNHNNPAITLPCFSPISRTLASSSPHIATRAVTSSRSGKQRRNANRSTAICGDNAGNTKINIWSIGYKKTINFESQQPSTAQRQLCCSNILTRRPP